MGFIKKCPHCGSINIVEDKKKGEIVCRDCGLVISDDIVDSTQEWREFSHEESGKRRAGAPVTFTKHDGGTGTKIGSGADVYSLPASQKRKMLRLRKWHSRSSTALERNLKYAIIELKKAASMLNIPPAVEEESARIYNLAVRNGLVRGRSMEAVVVGAIYIAARRYGLARSFNEVCKEMHIDRKELGKTYRFIARELNIKVMPSGPEDYIPKFASALGFSAKTQTKAQEILKRAKDVGLTSGRGPTGLAAAVLYVASLITGEKRTQRAIAEVVNVTEVTIRNRYKEILEKLNLEEELKEAIEEKKEEDKDEIILEE